MKTLKPLATLTLCLLSAFGTSVVLSPQKAKAQTVCSNRTLYGTYDVEGAEYLVYKPDFFPTAINSFDGNGKITSTIWAASIVGNLKIHPGPGGTYQVNSDCSFTATYTRYDGSTGHFSGIVNIDGNNFVFSQTDPGSNVTAKGTRTNNEVVPEEL